MPAELIRFLPTLNAMLNATSGILLTIGFIFIRRRRVQAHRACMIAALVSSSLFLISYLTYHYHAGTTRFAGTGAARVIYFVILTTHDPGGGDRAVRAGHGDARPARSVRPPPSGRALDAADVALRFGHRRHRLLHALSLVPVPPLG